eukprot:jgi/Chlat1/1954/Chrsp157S02261
MGPSATQQQQQQVQTKATSTSRPSDNLLHRLVQRETCAARPSASINRARTLYENIVPSHSVFNVDCPDVSYRKFTPDGRYLIAFSRSQQELVVFRYDGLRFCWRGEDNDEDEQMRYADHAKKFENHFTHLYSKALTGGAELLCKEFLLITCNGEFAIVPSMECITFHLVRLADGRMLDRRQFKDDFIQLPNNAGVFLYEDLLAVLSIRYQSIYILQVRPSGQLIDIHTIGPHCRADDNLVISLQLEAEARHNKATTDTKHCTFQRLAPAGPELQVVPSIASAGTQPTGTGRGAAGAGRGHADGLDDQHTHTTTTTGHAGGFAPGFGAHFAGRGTAAAAAPAGVGRGHYMAALMAHAASPPAQPQAPDGPAAENVGNHNNNANNQHAAANEGENATTAAVGTGNQPLPSTTATDGPSGSSSARASLSQLTGLKQRLLAFVHRSALASGGGDAVARFHYHLKHYEELAMWRVQFLDRHHLLVKYGSVEGVLQRAHDHAAAAVQNAFFMVYNLDTTEVLGFYQNASDQLLSLYERFGDQFRACNREPLTLSYASSPSNNDFAREQLLKQKAAVSHGSKTNRAQVVKRLLQSLPFNAQGFSPSAYFDQSLFQFDEKLISASEQPKPFVEHPVKFLSRRKPNTLKFKINPGLDSGAADARNKRLACYIFHPIFPFAISLQQAYMQPSPMNFHLRQ